ncbi:fructose-1,6-bisphosphatase class 1/Sedoheputulose-1,7-bisphosphatase [Dunaliella salina]|uniref:Fructose-1,6-bisphosphatase class 1/Sedoheputulose-1,7-bisphosphatase n=1 Tax=Dunaliella salina TaxID=3046 RepID=A0ABQ7GIP6_DUNSA|nr:fructose-1,6-bisphosphatase class 1/Sedoheputulose-1,7-bisphosphatase [Dunaliella salina]|eukprot:KAF5834456.1 fructose-1,6-bisphosphatase class 1/Sedoheputulose-1,7-bisphosphatase [Dunaliella salina]
MQSWLSLFSPVQGGGVFVNPSSSGAPAKLRLLYECAPLALIIEAAGGASTNGKESILDAPITSTSAKSTICLGAKDLVEQAMPAMQASL